MAVVEPVIGHSLVSATLRRYTFKRLLRSSVLSELNSLACSCFSAAASRRDCSSLANLSVARLRSFSRAVTCSRSLMSSPLGRAKIGLVAVRGCSARFSLDPASYSPNVSVPRRDGQANQFQQSLLGGLVDCPEQGHHRPATRFKLLTWLSLLFPESISLVKHGALLCGEF